MIKKLNNKGISTAEVLVCFVLIVLVSTAIYSIVETFKNKQQIESFKEKVTTYKNLLTKDINTDLIRIGLSSVSIPDSNKVELTLKNGVKKCLIVTQIVKSPNFLDDLNYQGNVSCVGACGPEEEFGISYGTCGDEIYYPLPDIGFSFNSPPYNNKIYDLRIKDFNISNDVKIEEGIFSINIRFYHPELGSKYGIYIVSPIDPSI